ncbi:MAG: hypothetical protein E7265_01680 [Lachnospiraceae bacterium]|nr:hypothetical protein [Lachnospiraceae bacterium]
MNVAVVGGDLRQCYLAGELLRRGYVVKTYDVACEGIIEELGGRICRSLGDAIEGCKVVVLPTPVTGEWTYVSELLPHDAIVFGWNVPKEFDAFLVYDFGKMEEVALRNAIATAEGTLAEAVKYGKINITGSKCLVVGYGRCGREIAAIFRGIGANVTVAERNKSKRDDVLFHGMDVCNMFEREDFSEYDFVINTVPARVLGRREIDKLGKNAVIIDIASVPGGTDFVYCKEAGRVAIHSLGLPGKYSPKTSGEILGHAVAGILETINIDRK